MKLLTLASLAAATAALSAGAAALPPPGADHGPAYAAEKVSNPPARACFYRRDIRNHTVGDAHTLYLDVGGRDVWRVSMSNGCLAAAASSDPIILRNQTGDPSVCRPIDLDISISTGGVSRCIVSSIARLTPAEVAALPKKMRP